MTRVSRIRDQDDESGQRGGAGPSAPARVRVLVDRLWPRGLAKADAVYDEWLKDVAPSSELRKWYGHAPERFAEFGRRYREELRSDEDAATAFGHLEALAAAGGLTLLTATRDLEISHARVLADLLDGTGD